MVETSPERPSENSPGVLENSEYYERFKEILSKILKDNDYKLNHVERARLNIFVKRVKIVWSKDQLIDAVDKDKNIVLKKFAKVMLLDTKHGFLSDGKILFLDPKKLSEHDLLHELTHAVQDFLLGQTGCPIDDFNENVKERKTIDTLSRFNGALPFLIAIVYGIGATIDRDVAKWGEEILLFLALQQPISIVRLGRGYKKLGWEAHADKIADFFTGQEEK